MNGNRDHEGDDTVGIGQRDDEGFVDAEGDDEMPADSAPDLGACLLRPDLAVTIEILRAWVTEELAGAGTVLAVWCQHWASKADKARHHREQVIIRSLVLQSLLRLHGLWKSSACTAMEEPCMLLDMDHGQTATQPEDA